MWMLHVIVLLFMLEECRSIFGGGELRPGEYPFVGYLTKNFEFNCTCIIVTWRWVLTTRHCFDPLKIGFQGEDFVKGITVVVGLGPHTQRFEGEKRIVLHFGDEDVALVYLEKEIVKRYKGRFVSPATFGIGRFPRRAEICSIVGWGRTKYLDDLQEQAIIDVMTVSAFRCDRGFASMDYIRKSQLCSEGTYGRGVCINADMGGPVICQKLVAGIVTRWLWGHYIAQPNYLLCGDRRQIVMSVRIHSLLAWLDENVGGHISMQYLQIASRNIFQSHALLNLSIIINILFNSLY